MRALNHILSKGTAGYKLSRLQEKIIHLKFMDDKKIFGNSGNSNTHRIYCHDIGMEFGIGKCAMLVMKRGKRHLT